VGQEHHKQRHKYSIKLLKSSMWTHVGWRRPKPLPSHTTHATDSHGPPAVTAQASRPPVSLPPHSPGGKVGKNSKENSKGVHQQDLPLTLPWLFLQSVFQMSTRHGN